MLDWPGASPFWTPDPSGAPYPGGGPAVEGWCEEQLLGQTTSLHEAARHGRYEVLSMLLHHSRGRGLLPGACLVPDGNGEMRWDQMKGEGREGKGVTAELLYDT